MKRILSMILSLIIILSILPCSAIAASTEGSQMIIKPSRYGAWENWTGSPNIVGDYDAATQLLVEATDASGNALNLPTNAQWSLTISAGEETKTIKMNPATTLSSVNLYRFETCNGAGENKFVPVKGVTYSVSATVTVNGTVLYESNVVSGFTCPMDPIDPAVMEPEPEGTVALNVTPLSGRIENYGTPTRTYFIVGVNAAEGNTLLYNRLKRGLYKLYVTVTDETTGTTATVYYPITKPDSELCDSTFMRLALAERGIIPVASHQYTIELDVYSGQELKYTGKSAIGAFVSTQEQFINNGAVVPELPEKSEENLLTGKSALFVGDSITEAICEVNIPQTCVAAGWPGRIGMANDMFFVNKGLSGASISDCRGTNTVLNQLMAMKNYSFDLLIMHGGVNDAWDSAPVGEMTALTNFDETSFDRSTFAGGLEYLFWYANTYYPDSVKGYIINFRLPGSSIGRLSDMSEYFETARAICDKWDIPYLDMYANDELNDRLKANTRYALGDYIHPNDRGYDILSPYVEQFCECIMKGEDPAALTDPERLPESGSMIMPGDQNVALGKTVINGAGASSTVPTDGKVDDYFYAGDWGTEETGSYGTSGNCYIEIDLGYCYDIDKINVVTFVGNLLYQWEAYATTDSTLPIEEWTKLGAKDGYEMSYEDGYTLTFEPLNARYIRIYGIYDNASTAFVFNEVSVYGTRSEDSEGTVVKPGNAGDATLPDGSVTDKLNDGNKTSDPVEVTPRNGGSILYDLGEVTDIQTIKTYTFGNDSSYGIYGSADGETWTLLGVKELNKASEGFDFSVGCCNVMHVSGSFRYLRWNWLSSTREDGYVSASEIEIYARGSETKLNGISVTETVDAVYGGNNTVDGDYNSYCFLRRKDDSTVIDLGEQVELCYVTLYPASNNSKLFFAASQDGKSNWITLGFANAGSTDPVTGSLIGEYRYLKLYTENGDGYSAYELEAYAVTEETDEPVVEPDEPMVEPDEPVTAPDEAVDEEELTAREEVTITLGNGKSANGLKDSIYDRSYTLIAEGDNCYALIDLQKNYELTRIVVNTYNGNYLFEVYGSVDGETYTKLAQNEVSSSYVASEGFELALSGEYRYVKVVGTSCQFGYFTAYEIDVFGSEATGEDGPAVDSDEPLVDSDEPAVDSDEPAVDSDERAVDSDEPAVDSDEPAVDFDEPAVDSDEPAVDPDEPVTTPDEAVDEEELTAREEVTITLGNGKSANGLKDSIYDRSYTLIAEGDNCYALIDLQKNYELTRMVVNTYNGNYLFEVYGSVDGETYTKLAQNEVSSSYVASEGFELELSGEYRYVKVVGISCQFGYFTAYEIDVFGS